MLSRFYRRLFLERLQAAFDAGRLRFFGDMARLAEARAFAAQTKRLRKISWVVYAKPPFGSPDQVLAYLGRHPSRGDRQQPARGHRRARVRFRWRLSTGEPKQAMTLDASEFIRRFLRPADGFHRIRHYGFHGQRAPPEQAP